MRGKSELTLRLLKGLPVYVFLAVILIFAPMSNRFLQVNNFLNILVQATPVGILATGMKFTLLTAGIDLSVGAAMYLAACLLGIYLKGAPLPAGLGAMLLVGLAVGAVNGSLVAFLRVAPVT